MEAHTWLEKRHIHKVSFSASVIVVRMFLPLLRGRKIGDRVCFFILPLPAKGECSILLPWAKSLYLGGEAGYKWHFPMMENHVFPQSLILLFLFSSLSHAPLQKVMQSSFGTCSYHRRWHKTARFSPTVRSFSQAQLKPEMSSRRKGGARTLF